MLESGLPLTLWPSYGLPSLTGVFSFPGLNIAQKHVATKQSGNTKPSLTQFLCIRVGHSYPEIACEQQNFLKGLLPY